MACPYFLFHQPLKFSPTDYFFFISFLIRLYPLETLFKQQLMSVLTRVCPRQTDAIAE